MLYDRIYIADIRLFQTKNAKRTFDRSFLIQSLHDLFDHGHLTLISRNKYASSVIRDELSVYTAFTLGGLNLIPIKSANILRKIPDIINLCVENTDLAVRTGTHFIKLRNKLLSHFQIFRRSININ